MDIVFICFDMCVSNQAFSVIPEALTVGAFHWSSIILQTEGNY